jgi:hypothetical protein
VDPATTAVGSAEARAFEALERGFRRARSRPGIEVRRLSFTLAGRAATLEVAGQALFDRIAPALVHLVREERAGRAAGFSATLWDADATGVREVPPAPGEDPTARADISVSADGRWVVQRRTHAVVGHDRARGAVVGWFRDVERLPLYDRGRPLHPQILLANQDRGAPPLHAALVARRGRGALLVGEGGSGKTTASLACFLAGFDFLGDDYVSLLPDGRGRYVGHGVYSSTHVDPLHLERFPELHASAVFPSWEGEDKAVVFLADVVGRATGCGRLARESPIDALFLPTVRSGPTRVVPATPGEAGLRLVQGAIALAPHAGAGGMPALLELAASVPAFRLDLGPDLAEIPRAIAAVLEGLRA